MQVGGNINLSLNTGSLYTPVLVAGGQTNTERLVPSTKSR